MAQQHFNDELTQNLLRLEEKLMGVVFNQSRKVSKPYLCVNIQVSFNEFYLD